jgi:hypothetical protein
MKKLIIVIMIIMIINKNKYKSNIEHFNTIK